MLRCSMLSGQSSNFQGDMEVSHALGAEIIPLPRSRSWKVLSVHAVSTLQQVLWQRIHRHQSTIWAGCLESGRAGACGGNEMREVLGGAVFWLLLANARNSAQENVPASSSLRHSPSDTSNNATCISRTVNYITHTLPQQCLNTDRHSVNITLSGSPNVSQIATVTGDVNPAAGTTGTTLTTPESLFSASAHLDSLIAPQGPNSSKQTTQSTPASPPAASLETAASTDADFLLDDASFLSFEEWKKQNLAKAGQSPEHVGQERSSVNGNRQRPGIKNALDSLGEENEIDLDFSGFVGARSSETSATETSTEPGLVEESSVSGPVMRSKDAGKTCKERTNYASFDCAATVLKSNPECKSPSSILVENKDSYMLNTCSATNKFIIIELCNDILVDTVVLANYEFFSSIFRHFRVSVADRYPVKPDKWRDLGTFEARNTREVQAFLVENPLIWARYLRIEFLSHYGKEYYCPLSLLRVHGTTMLEEFRHQEEIARGDISDEEPVLEAEVTAAPAVEQEPLAATDESGHSTVQKITSLEASESGDINSENASTPTTAESSTSASHVLYYPSNATYDGAIVVVPQHTAANDMTCPTRPAGNGDPTTQGTGPEPYRVHETEPATSSIDVPNKQRSLAGSKEDDNSISERTSNATTALNSVQATNGTYDASTEAAHHEDGKRSATAPPVVTARTSENTTAHTQPAESPGRTVPPTTTASHQPQPSTQESFFKSVHKRLQQLESNSTLSLQYIEEQSRILRDAFNKVEKRQLSNTEKFLSQLNDTVMHELRGYAQAYDQLWQSIVLENEGHREQYQREMLALSARLTLVADELVWQKRMGIVQSTLILLCLGLVLFARPGHGYLEIPLAQQLMHKSQAAFRAGWESEPHSPSSPISRSPVSLFRRKVWRSSTEPVSGSLTEATESRPGTRDGPDVHVEPPTPPGWEDEDEDDVYLDPEEVMPGIQSGPATPGGAGAGLKRTVVLVRHEPP
jgi:hypothetical protein